MDDLDAIEKEKFDDGDWWLISTVVYFHIYISKILLGLNNHGANICLPLLNEWLDKPQIDNIVIINHPEDAERICKDHVKKAPIFKSFLYNSIISTTDNADWKEQRSFMNMAFIPKLSLQRPS